jgi:tRNA pseudouridine38-40 synthase
MRNIKLTIEYDGKDFNGWQKQPTKLNIQGTIEQAIEAITGETVELNASGRTDAGVHAIGQVANFKTDSNIPIEKMAIAINSKLKKTIRIINAEKVDERFHSRLTCKRKTYRYVINNSKTASAIYRNLEYHISQKLDIEKMKQAAKYFEGEHDFKAFKASGTSSKSSVRTIYKAEVYEKENERIAIELTRKWILIQHGKNYSWNTSRSRFRKNKTRRNFKNYIRRQKRKCRKNFATLWFVFGKGGILNV